MNEKKQILLLKLEGECLQVQGLDKYGNGRSEATTWTIREYSVIPRNMFHKLRGFLQQSIKRHGTGSAEHIWEGALAGLEQAGMAFGCEIGHGSKKADLYWQLDGTRFVAWQIHERKLDVQRLKKLQKSKALLRIVVIVKKGGFFEIKPQQTRLAN